MMHAHFEPALLLLQLLLPGMSSPRSMALGCSPCSASSSANSSTNASAQFGSPIGTNRSSGFITLPVHQLAASTHKRVGGIPGSRCAVLRCATVASSFELVLSKILPVLFVAVFPSSEQPSLVTAAKSGCVTSSRFVVYYWGSVLISHGREGAAPHGPRFRPANKGSGKPIGVPNSPLQGPRSISGAVQLSSRCPRVLAQRLPCHSPPRHRRCCCRRYARCPSADGVWGCSHGILPQRCPQNGRSHPAMRRAGPVRVLSSSGDPFLKSNSTFRDLVADITRITSSESTKVLWPRSRIYRGDD